MLVNHVGLIESTRLRSFMLLRRDQLTQFVSKVLSFVKESRQLVQSWHQVRQVLWLCPSDFRHLNEYFILYVFLKLYKVLRQALPADDTF